MPRPPKKPRPHVVIVWLTSREASEYASVLTCREGVRVYERDRVDHRCLSTDGKPPPYFKAWDAACRWMLGEGAGPLACVQLHEDEARRVGILTGERLVAFYDTPRTVNDAPTANDTGGGGA